MMVVDRLDSLRFGRKSDLKWRLILVMWLLVYGGLTVADGWIYGRRLLGIMVVVVQIDRKKEVVWWRRMCEALVGCRFVWWLWAAIKG